MQMNVSLNDFGGRRETYAQIDFTEGILMLNQQPGEGEESSLKTEALKAER